MIFRDLLAQNRSDLALLIGNGINRYRSPSNENSWENILSKLSATNLGSTLRISQTGISLTEFYDIMELKCSNGSLRGDLAQQFCELIKKWEPQTQHRDIANWAKQHKAPILTTNFDSTISKAANSVLRRIPGKGFSAFYPWDSYYAPTVVSNPCDQFAVWHVNGMLQYSRSIRLGLSHYMGSVERARRWFRRGSDPLFNTNDVAKWPGASSWLQIFIHKPLVIVGLGLTETEVFLRWLLIERARYFNKFPTRRKSGWYVHTKTELSHGKKIFLETVGIQPFEVVDYDDIYSECTWAINN